MNRIGKTYTLKNGYGVCKASLYDGIETQYFWVVIAPDNTIKCGNIGSYEKAYTIAKSLG